MKLFPLTIILMIGLLSSCGVLYKNDASKPIKAGDIKVGMSKESVIAKLGQPFAYNLTLSDSDTLTTYSYKTHKIVDFCSYIVTTDLLFINDSLKSISQKDFYVAKYVLMNDTTQKMKK